MLIFCKRKKYNVDVKTADRILQNVFSESHVEPNTISFETIVKKNRISLVSDNIYVVLAIVLFLVTLIIPLFLPRSNVRLSVESSVDRELSVVTHSLDNNLFTITLNGPKVDFAASYIVDSEGHEHVPVSFDQKNNTLVFPVEAGDYNIFIYDINGNCLHLLLSSASECLH
ncbi:MAG: hypothetical protein K6E19_04705 [Lachnospiraceae bacterium]|nr:hypothetical protein [Lachnospiraceae bacterium]